MVVGPPFRIPPKARPQLMQIDMVPDQRLTLLRAQPGENTATCRRIDRGTTAASAPHIHTLSVPPRPGVPPISVALAAREPALQPLNYMVDIPPPVVVGRP
jgi:hypothetical protein